MESEQWYPVNSFKVERWVKFWVCFWIKFPNVYLCIWGCQRSIYMLVLPQSHPAYVSTTSISLPIFSLIQKLFSHLIERDEHELHAVVRGYVMYIWKRFRLMCSPVWCHAGPDPEAERKTSSVIMRHPCLSICKVTEQRNWLLIKKSTFLFQTAHR